jgi:predicted FMN-binding regulatory protein PaiB
MRSLVSKKQNISQVPTWYRSFTAKGQFAHDSNSAILQAYVIYLVRFLVSIISVADLL